MLLVENDGLVEENDRLHEKITEYIGKIVASNNEKYTKSNKENEFWSQNLTKDIKKIKTHSGRNKKKRAVDWNGKISDRKQWFCKGKSWRYNAKYASKITPTSAESNATTISPASHSNNKNKSGTLTNVCLYCALPIGLHVEASFCFMRNKILLLKKSLKKSF